MNFSIFLLLLRMAEVVVAIVELESPEVDPSREEALEAAEVAESELPGVDPELVEAEYEVPSVEAESELPALAVEVESVLPEVAPAAVEAESELPEVVAESELPAVEAESELPAVEAESEDPDVEAESVEPDDEAESELDVEADDAVVAGDVVRSDVAWVVPVVCSNSFWTTTRAWVTVLMAVVIVVTTVVIEFFSAVVQVTVEDTEVISAERVSTIVASGKEVTMDIKVVALVMTELQEVAVCLAPLCLELVAPLARLAILVLAALRASWLAFSWAAF